jgi:hypothetical protein
VPSDRDWAVGFLEQARADLDAARVLATQGLTTSRASVLAMLLQMAFEKFAKAALLRSRSTTYATAKGSHKAASTMVAVMWRQRGALIGGRFRWSAALGVMEELERAQPSLAKGAAQLEYPWEDSSSIVRCPARDLPLAFKLANPNSTLALHVIEFASWLDQHFDTVFP